MWGAGKQHKKDADKKTVSEEFTLRDSSAPTENEGFTLPPDGSEEVSGENHEVAPPENFVERYIKQKFDWAAEVEKIGGSNPLLYLHDDATACLDLSAAHPGGLPQFISGNTILLSQLIRDGEALRRSKLSAAAITDKQAELRAMRSLDTVFLAVGIAKWSFEGEQHTAPVMLRSLAIRRFGDDYQLKLKNSVQFNEALIRALRVQFGIHLNASEYVKLSHESGVFKPQPVIDKLRQAAAGVPGFLVQPRLVVANVSDHAHEMHADLNNLDNLILETMAGSLVAKDRLQSSFKDVSFYSGPDRDPKNDNYLYSTDTQQEEVLDQILAGNSVTVQTLPGTGGTQTIVNAIGALVSVGKQVLVVTPRRSTLESINYRLRRSHLPGLAVTPRLLRRNIVEAIGRNEIINKSLDSEIEAALTRLRTVLQDYRRALVMADQKLGVSPLEALHVLSSLMHERVPPTTTVRLDPVTLENLAVDRSRVLEALVEVARLGQFEYGPSDSPWYNVSFHSSEEAHKMHQVAIRLAETEFPRLTAKASEVISQTPMRSYATIAELGVYLRLLTGLKETLDRFVPEVFDRSLTEVIAAHAPRGAEEISGANRRRLRKLAKEYVRPGVTVDDMYSRLVQIQQQRVLWQRYSSIVGARPEIPNGVSELVSLYQGVYQELDELDACLDPEQTGTRLRNMGFDDLARLINSLAAPSKVLENIHERTALVEELHAAGLGPLLDDLSDRHIPVSTVLNELEQAWWQSALEHMLQKNAKLLGANTSVIERLEEDFKLVDDARSRANGPALAKEFSKLWRVALRDHDGEAKNLKTLLHSADVTVKDLANMTPNMLHSLVKVWAVSPYEVSTLPRSLHFDTVLLVDASAVTTPEVLNAITRASQVVAFGDPVSQKPASFTISPAEVLSEEPENRVSAFEELAEILPAFRLTQSYRAGGADLLELVNTRFYDGDIVSLPWAGTFLGKSSIERIVVANAKGLPDPVSGAVETTEAEVNETLRLVLKHLEETPEQTLMVLTTTEKHANRISAALLQASSQLPELKDFLMAQSNEQFVILDIEKAAAETRDHVIFSIGYGKTPHGRVLSSFGKLSEPGSEYLVASAMTRARERMTILSSFSADELEPERARHGARELREILVDRQYTRTSTALPEEIDPLLQELSNKLRELGLRSELDYQGMIPLVAGFQGKAMAIDIDSQKVGRSLREILRLRPILLRRLGWQYHRVHSFDLFADPHEVAVRIAKNLGWSDKLREQPEEPQPEESQPEESQPEVAQPEVPEPQVYEPAPAPEPVPAPAPAPVPESESAEPPVIEDSSAAQLHAETQQYDDTNPVANGVVLEVLHPHPEENPDLIEHAVDGSSAGEEFDNETLETEVYETGSLEASIFELLAPEGDDDDLEESDTGHTDAADGVIEENRFE